MNNRQKPFEETELYESIITNNIRMVRAVLCLEGKESECHTNSLQHNLEGYSYLHLAVEHHVSPVLFSLLLTYLSPAHR